MWACMNVKEQLQELVCEQEIQLLFIPEVHFKWNVIRKQ